MCPFLRTIEGDSIAKNSENLHILYDNVEIALGGLAAGDAISADSRIDNSRLNGFRVMKTEYWLDYYDKTTDEGPIMVGFSMNHSVAEVEEAFEADPQASTDDTNNFRAKRPIWPLEMIARDSTELGSGDQRSGSITPRWSCPEGNTAIWWAYNCDLTNPITTGTKVRIFAKHYGVWLRD